MDKEPLTRVRKRGTEQRGGEALSAIKEKRAKTED